MGILREYMKYQKICLVGYYQPSLAWERICSCRALPFILSPFHLVASCDLMIRQGCAARWRHPAVCGAPAIGGTGCDLLRCAWQVAQIQCPRLQPKCVQSRCCAVVRPAQLSSSIDPHTWLKKLLPGYPCPMRTHVVWKRLESWKHKSGSGAPPPHAHGLRTIMRGAAASRITHVTWAE